MLYIYILHFQLAEIIKKDKSKCTALVQLLSDRDELVNMNYDSICEYVGDIHAEFDYWVAKIKSSVSLKPQCGFMSQYFHEYLIFLKIHVPV